MPAGPAIAACGLAGVLAGLLTDIGAGDALAASLALPALALVAGRRAVRAALLAAAFAALTMAEGAVARDRALDPPLGRWVDARADATGLTPVVQVSGRLAADAERTAFGVRLLVRVEHAGDGPAADVAAATVQVHVSGERALAAHREWTAGRPIATAIALSRPALLRNPGDGDPRWPRLRRPHQLAGTVKSAFLVVVQPGRWWDEAAAAVRRRVRDAVSRHVGARDAQTAAVVTAILIGDRVGLAPEIEDRLQRAGTYHVIAISGGNVALLTALCFFGLRAVLGTSRVVPLLTMIAVLAYGLVVAGDPSVRRAVTAACLYLALGALGLAPRPIHVLATVGLLVALVDPLTVLQVGAWLSFGATAAIVLGARRLVRWFGTHRVPPLARSAVIAASALFAATLLAELALLPVQAAVFGRVGVAGLLLNFVAIPAMACVQVLGLATAMLAGWAEPIAAWTGALAHAAARLLLESAGLVDRWPWLSWRVPPASPVWTVGYYAAVAVAAWPAPGVRWRRAAGLAAAVAAVAIVSAPALERRQPPGERLRLAVLDVGQGDAILVQLPGGRALLVDAGGSHSGFDVGGRLVTPAAWALGARRLDWLLLTHGDRDHVGGAPAVVRDLAPGEIWEGVPVASNADLAGLRTAARALGIVWRQVSAGHALRVGDVELTVEHPPLPDWERPRVRNDDSVVLRLRYGRVELLLTGDAGPEFESRWPAAPSGSFRILKVAHHGSRTSTGEAFVARYAPALAIVSAGRRNPFGHPAPDVLARLAGAGAAAYRTDRDGAVIVETDGREVWLRTMAGGRAVWRADGPA